MSFTDDREFGEGVMKDTPGDESLISDDTRTSLELDICETYSDGWLLPKEIVSELDRFIIGQEDAKRAVSIALRNRWRRSRVVPKELKDEIIPKNILMVGHTGVGKTEIARRLAKLIDAPFIKVEATKFTEIGYVGRDVDSIIRDLVDVSVGIVKEKFRRSVAKEARASAENIILNSLIGSDASDETREKILKKLKEGECDRDIVSISIRDRGMISSFEIPGVSGGQVGVMNIGEIMQKMLAGNKQLKTVTVPVKEAIDILIDEESDRLIDEDKIIRSALHVASNDGIVFLDEIDKIAARTEIRGEVSREGVQRDLLPLLEGTSVTTKYGTIRTDHILFIASGAFHLAKPSDLLPEFQGRLPIRVDLKSLTTSDIIRILKEPEANLLKQYIALMRTEGVDISFTDCAVYELADITSRFNTEVENIGARRLHTILEKLMEDLSFDPASYKNKGFIIDSKYVKDKLSSISQCNDLSRFIL